MLFLQALHTSVASVLFHCGLLYAAATTLEQRRARASDGVVLLGTAALKLWVMLGFLAFLSAVGFDRLPLFVEMRVILVYLILLAPPASQEEVYDRSFAPLLLQLGAWLRSARSSRLLTRRVGLFVVAQCTNLSLAIVNYAQRHGALEEDAVADITGGLVFTRRALHDVAHAEREEARGRSKSPSARPPFASQAAGGAPLQPPPAAAAAAAAKNKYI